jgi:hypothetical protein
MADFYIKKGDLLPKITGTLVDSTGAAINLTGATVKLRMRLPGAASAKVDTAAAVLSASAGTVEYTWASGNTDTVGVYNAEWVLTFGSTLQTVPNNGFMQVVVGETLA